MSTKYCIMSRNEPFHIQLSAVMSVVSLTVFNDLQKPLKVTHKELYISTTLGTSQ